MRCAHNIVYKPLSYSKDLLALFRRCYLSVVPYIFCFVCGLFSLIIHSQAITTLMEVDGVLNLIEDVVNRMNVVKCFFDFHNSRYRTKEFLCLDLILHPMYYV